MTIKAQTKGLPRYADFEDYINSKPSDFELNWGRGFGLEEVQDMLGLDFVEDALEGLQSLTTFLISVVEIVDAIVDVVALALGIATDAFSALGVIIREVLESVINLFTGVSINPLFHFPTSYKTRRRPNEIMYDLGMAYLDQKDLNRPITIQDTFGVALVALFSAPNIEQLLNKFGELGKLFKGLGSDASFDLDSRFNKIEERYSRNRYGIGDYYIFFQDFTLNDVPSDADNRKFIGYINSKAPDRDLGLYVLSEVEGRHEIYNYSVGSFRTKEEADRIKNQYFSDDYAFVFDNKVIKAKEYLTLRTGSPLNSSMSGQAPDFDGSLQLTDFAYIRDIIKDLNSLIINIEKGRSRLDKFKAIIASTERRLQRITDTAQRITQAIASLTALLALGGGAKMFSCMGTGKDRDFAHALINAPLHPNYPNSDLLEENQNISQQKSPLSTITQEVGESALFSGGMLLHFGVSDPRADYQNLVRVINLFMQTVDAEQVEKKFDPFEDRFNRT
jgi:hypothetical protein